jgi:hypothetical protein
MYMPAKAKTTEMWTNRKKACLAVEMELHQDGDREGCLLFDPRNAAQAKVAIQVAAVKIRRIMTQAQKEDLAKRFGQSRPTVSTPTGEQYVVGQRIAGVQGR